MKLLGLLLPACIPGLALCASLDHSAWDTLLKEYVNEQHRVDYDRLKRTAGSRLDVYLEQLARKWPESVTPEERKAALINAYNALTVEWIIRNYPVASIWRTDNPFKARRHTIDGSKVSLDDIETELRNTAGTRIHSVLVCAARSCPPLRREAYVAARLEEQLDDNTRAWLADDGLNEFHPSKRKAEVSKIFDWYGNDFEQHGETLQKFLARYGPEGESVFLREGKAEIKFKNYHWGLNDTSDLGSGYSNLNFYWDKLKNSL